MYERRITTARVKCGFRGKQMGIRTITEVETHFFLVTHLLKYVII